MKKKENRDDAMQGPKKIQRLILQGIKFGIVGLLNTVLSYLIYLLCFVLGMHYLLCEFVAFFITVGISYLLNQRFVFENSVEGIREKVKAVIKTYFSYFCTSFVLNAVLLIFWIEALEISETIAPIVSLLLTVPINFLLNKFWVHKR